MNQNSDPLRQDLVLQAQRVSFGYAEPLFEDVNIELERGSSLAIMGRSGSGKSTLLQLLAGILSPTFGDVIVAGERLRLLNARKLAELRLHSIGFVFQSGELIPELTLQENVELPALFAGARRNASRHVAQELLEIVGLANERSRFVHEVSGGQLQRAAVARALVQQPAVVLADEPTGALDAEAADEVLHLLLDLAPARGAGVVVVTHAKAVADRCDYLVQLRQGALVRGN
jgi:putative ABC transport system ATP-binding protein